MVLDLNWPSGITWLLPENGSMRQVSCRMWCSSLWSSMKNVTVFFLLQKRLILPVDPLTVSLWWRNGWGRISRANDLNSENQKDYFINVAEELATVLWQKGLGDRESIKGNWGHSKKPAGTNHKPIKWTWCRLGYAGQILKAGTGHPEIQVSWSNDGKAWLDLPTEQMLSPGKISF